MHAAMEHQTADLPVIEDELVLLARLVPLAQASIIELGCGKAELARRLVAQHPGATVLALEVDARQHAKNLQQPTQRIRFVEGGAQAIAAADASFDLALMLKSLHHVPLDQLDRALDETWRVLRPGGLLYVSEPVFAGPLNEVMRVFHDEEVVRAAAYAAVQRAAAGPRWETVDERFFDVPVHYRDFEEFRQRMIGVTFVDHRLDAATLAEVERRFMPHQTADGAHFMRPMRVNLLRKRS